MGYYIAEKSMGYCRICGKEVKKDQRFYFDPEPGMLFAVVHTVCKEDEINSSTKKLTTKRRKKV